MLSCRTPRLAAFLSILAFLAVPAAAEAPIPAGAKMVPDPAVKHGRLPNGLRYAVMQNVTPANAISIRLAMKVGSYEESDSERGYAHFVEHMAFRSTKQAPDGAFNNRFAAFGVAIGRDQNAVTGLENTIYRIDLPTNNMEAVRTVLTWMRGAADGILFTPAAVEVERGVVIAEKQGGESPVADMQERASRFQGPGLRSVDRNPGGTLASLRAATPAALQAFYDRWYRPENGMLVITGDAPAAELERALTEAFASWSPRGPAGVRPAPATQASRALDAISLSGPALPAGLSACRLSAPDLDRSPTIERIRRALYSELWTAILNKRFGHLASTGNSPLLGAGATVNREIPDSMIACLIVAPADGRWKEALAAAQGEFRRFAEAGPTKREVDTVIENMRSALRAQTKHIGTRSSSTLADQIVGAEFDGRIFQDPIEAMRTYDIAMAGVNSADVRRAFASDWRGTGPVLVATGPAAPAKAELLAAWQANDKAAPLEAYADRAVSTWAYSGFGPPGKVASRQSFTDPDYVRITFENGVMLSFKHTDFQAHGAEIRVRFGWGEKALDPDARLPAALGAGVFPMGGLGRMDFEQISSALTNTTWMFSLGVETDSWQLSSSPMAEQVPQQLQLLAAYMTDPGFRPLMGDKLPTAIDFVYRSYRTEPGTVALVALENALYPGKTSVPPRETMAAWRVPQFERLMRPVLTNAPIEVTIVGDVSEADAIKAVASSFGALPPRRPLAPVAGEGPFRRFPARLPAAVRTVHEGPAEKAAAIMVWPLYVATPERRSEEYAISLVAQIFQTRLLQRARVTMGKTYSPTVASAMPDAADEGFLAAALEATPADIDALVGAAKAIAAELVAGRISQEEVDAARDPMVAARLQAQSRNEAWAGILSASVRHPEAFDELLAFKGQMQALTLDDVRKAAAKWLARAPFVSTALPAKPTATARR
jgi:zinc protease